MHVRTHKQSKSGGFTIVELLIVIVVIGILAAITIVAYGGIQQRARNANTISAVNSYLTAFQGYVALNGGYPAVPSNANYCLGQEVVNCTGAVANWTRSATLETALKTIMTPLPTPSNGPRTNVTSNPNLGYIPARTSTEDPKVNGVNSAVIIYILEGDVPCSAGTPLSGGWPAFSSTAPSGGHTALFDGDSHCFIALSAK